MFAEPPLQEERIERFLNVWRASGQFVQEETERLRLFRQQHSRRTKYGAFADNPGNAADIFWCNLRTEQRPAGQARFGSRLHNGIRFSDTWRRKEQDTLIVRHRPNDRLRLTERYCGNVLVEIHVGYQYVSGLELTFTLTMHRIVSDGFGMSMDIHGTVVTRPFQPANSVAQADSTVTPFAYLANLPKTS